MPLRLLKIENWRNYQNFQLELSPKVNFIYGRNGSGKSNLIEAIFFGLFFKSYRAKKEEELVFWKKGFFRLNLDFFQEKIEKTEVFFSPSVKQVKIDGVKIPLLKALGKTTGVLFIPEMLGIIAGRPAERRRFLDLILLQTNNKYPYLLVEFQKILRQRNALLESIKNKKADSGQLDVWDENFLTVSRQIIKLRQGLVDFLSSKLNDIYRQISHHQEIIKIGYQPSDLEKFSPHRQRDIILGFTEIGPHRDDVGFFINGHQFVAAGSRGEIRTLVLALKVLELEYLRQVGASQPILLLDDVFSELDRSRRDFLRPIVKQYQAVVTSVENEEWKGVEKINLGDRIKI